MSTTRVRERVRLPPAPLTTALLALAAAAWVAVVLTHGAGEHAHGVHEAAGDPAPIRLAGWTLMVIAMMLPPALPLAGVLAALLSGRPSPVPRLAVALAAFVAVWVVTGAMLLAGADLVAGVVGPQHRTHAAGVVVLVAGLYQFTPLKNACLTACRSPRWFALRFWSGRGVTRDAATVAGAYGISCVGCCWALMLLCLGTGAFALPVMVMLAVVMAAERLVRGGRPVAWVTGVVLALGGAALLTGVLPPSLAAPLLGA